MLLAFLGCTPPAVTADSGEAPVVTDTQDSKGDTSWPDDSEGDETAEETGEVVIDRDGDGYPVQDDCDDDDDAIHPGATEVFDGYDNDCDGVIDANGSYSGTLSLSAKGWYEGTPHDLSYSCPMEAERALTSAAWTVTCSTEESDTWGRLLIGETLTLTPEDDYLWDLELWEGTVIVASSEGWDTYATGTLTWNTMEKATLVVGLDTTWLDFTGSGKLKR